MSAAFIGDGLFLGTLNEKPSVELPAWSAPIATFGSQIPFVDRCLEYYSQFSGIPSERLHARAFFYGASLLIVFFGVLIASIATRAGMAERMHAAALRTNNIKKRKFDLGDLIVSQGTGALLAGGIIYFLFIGNVMADLSESDTSNLCIEIDKATLPYLGRLIRAGMTSVVLISGLVFGYLFSLPFLWLHLKRHHCVGWRFVGAEPVEQMGPKSARLVGRILLILLTIACVGAYAGWLFTYAKTESYPIASPLVAAANNAVFLPNERRPEGNTEIMRKIRQTIWCQKAKEWETQYPQRFRTFDCSVIRPVDARFDCSLWWLGRQCLFVDIYKSTYEIPEVREAVIDALQHPCKHVSPASYPNDAPLLGTADYINCSKYSPRNASDVYLRILNDSTGAAESQEVFPSKSRKSKINRLYRMFGGT